MIDKKVWRRKLQGVITLILSLFIVASALCGASSAGPSAAKPAADDSFVLSIQGDLISLKAKEAPIISIVKEIGRKLEIEIAGEMPDTEKVSIEFEKLAFDEAMARLGVDYVYVTDKGNRIIKVTLLPKDEGESGPMAAAQSASVRTVGNVPTPSGGVLTEEQPQRQLAPEKPKDNKAPSSEPFKFEFKP